MLIKDITWRTSLFIYLQLHDDDVYVHGSTLGKIKYIYHKGVVVLII